MQRQVNLLINYKYIVNVNKVHISKIFLEKYISVSKQQKQSGWILLIILAAFIF